MPPFLTSLIAVAALGAYAAIHHGWLWLRQRNQVVHREFAILAITVAAACAAEIWLQTASGDVSLRHADTAVWLCHLLEGACLVRFVHRCSAPQARLLPVLLQGAMGLGIILLLILPNGYMSSPERISGSVVLPWGEPVRYLLGQASPIYWLVSAAAAACLVWCLAVTWRAWRGGGGARQLVLLLALAIIATAVGNSIIADIYGAPTVPLINHSFALLALVMGQILTEAVLRAAMLEERLRHAERHEQLGRLAAGVAHDFGNLLTAVVGNAELLADELSDRPQARERARSIVTAGLAGSTLTRRMLAFARGGDRQQEAVQVCELLAQVCALARSGRARPELRLAPDTVEARVEGDPAQLLSLFLNLVLNARDALGKTDGRITITTSLRSPTAEARLRHHPQPGPLLEIAVTDNGPGIPPEVAARLFEPYNSSKGGSGTGLGLLQVDEAVRDHHGALSVESLPGTGTTFRIWLPLLVASSSNEVPRASGNQRVLVVADEAAVRQLTEAALAALGYAVTSVRGANAVGQTTHGERIEAVVIDLPGNRGPELLAEMRRLVPALPAVVVGGGDEAPTTAILKRPARTADLGHALARVMER